MSSKAFASFLVAVLLATASGCGVVRYRETKFTVRDKVSNDPVRHARVCVQMMGVVGKWNAGKVPLFQSGSTDDQGDWKATVPMSQCGYFSVECDGYESELVNIEEDTLRNGKLDVALRRVDEVPQSSRREEMGSNTNPPVHAGG
jgi:hypothetical protein